MEKVPSLKVDGYNVQLAFEPTSVSWSYGN